MTWPQWANTKEVRERLNGEMNSVFGCCEEGRIQGCVNLLADDRCDRCPLKPAYEPWP